MEDMKMGSIQKIVQYRDQSCLDIPFFLLLLAYIVHYDTFGYEGPLNG